MHNEDLKKIYDTQSSIRLYNSTKQKLKGIALTPSESYENIILRLYDYYITNHP